MHLRKYPRIWGKYGGLWKYHKIINGFEEISQHMGKIWTTLSYVILRKYHIEFVMHLGKYPSIWGKYGGLLVNPLEIS